MQHAGKFFCGVGQPNVVTRIKCGDPCINFGVAISSRGDATATNIHHSWEEDRGS